MNNTDNEVYKDIKDWEDKYQVSDKGNVRSKDRTITYNNRNRKQYYKGQVLKPSKDKYGYYYVQLSNHKKNTKRYIHQLVAETFIGECPDNCDVHHINRNITDNRKENLQILSEQEHIALHQVLNTLAISDNTVLSNSFA